MKLFERWVEKSFCFFATAIASSGQKAGDDRRNAQLLSQFGRTGRNLADCPFSGPFLDRGRGGHDSGSLLVVAVKSYCSLSLWERVRVRGLLREVF